MDNVVVQVRERKKKRPFAFAEWVVLLAAPTYCYHAVWAVLLGASVAELMMSCSAWGWARLHLSPSAALVSHNVPPLTFLRSAKAMALARSA
jgi:hypothetical protein